MAKLSEEYASDEEGAKNGKWFTLRPAKGKPLQPGETLKPGEVPYSPALRVCIRGGTSKPVRHEEQKLHKKLRPATIANGGYMDVETQDEFEIGLCFGAVVTGWEGVDDDNGNPVPYSRANVKELVTKFPQFRREILAWCRSEENFRPAESAKADLDKMAGN